MARVQLVLSDGDRDRYVSQAKREGKTLSAWLREAAQEKIEGDAEQHRPFETAQDVREFFRACDATRNWHGPEPDWEEQKKLISEARLRGATLT